MSLEAGTENADAGMSQAIYQQIDQVLSPPLQDVIDKAKDEAKAAAQATLEEARIAWKKLSYAIAKGVIDHIKANMEIVGVQTQGSVSLTVGGNTGFASGHLHSVSLSGTKTNVTFTQSNDGTGHVA